MYVTFLSLIQKYREIRFSFDGLVIHREVGVAIPVHLSLHHHGDEPEVCYFCPWSLSN